MSEKGPKPITVFKSPEEQEKILSEQGLTAVPVGGSEEHGFHYSVKPEGQETTWPHVGSINQKGEFLLSPTMGETFKEIDEIIGNLRKLFRANPPRNFPGEQK